MKAKDIIEVIDSPLHCPFHNGDKLTVMVLGKYGFAAGNANKSWCFRMAEEGASWRKSIKKKKIG